MSEDTAGKRLALGEEMSRTLGETADMSDPAHRIASALFVLLRNQLELLGFAPGTVPFDARFGSDACRGALLGTAFAVTRGHREAPEWPHFNDAIVAAFTVVYGEQVGPAKAAETIEDSGNRHAAVNAAAELASQDTIATWSDDSPSMPMAFYNAANPAH